MNKQNGNGNRDNSGKRMASALIVTALLAALVLLFAAYGPGSAPQTASAHKISISRPAEDGTHTPEATEPPDGTEPPHATRPPEGTETHQPEATETHQSEGTETPEATRPPEGTETHQPEATETHQSEGTRTPEATRTHEPDATEPPESTEPPEASHTPEATQPPDSSETPEATRTHEPDATEPPESTEPPEASHTPEATEPPDATETQQPEGTETQQPEGTETQQPEATDTPEASGTPEATDTPEATQTGMPEPTETALAPIRPIVPATIPGAGSATFPETNKTVQGIFLQYWNNNGGLQQQGYPISSAVQEQSQTDGKFYAVQYFERAVFEYHPELAGSNNVLLSLLGTFRYNSRYPSGASGQMADKSGTYFPQTGHYVGGTFLKYWQQHGGLAQQGYPISDEFTEVSPLNGKSYTVQYFERAVFELHPENQAPYNVLLSQLGTFQYKAMYSGK